MFTDRTYLSYKVVYLKIDRQLFINFLQFFLPIVLYTILEISIKYNTIKKFSINIFKISLIIKSNIFLLSAIQMNIQKITILFLKKIFTLIFIHFYNI